MGGGGKVFGVIAAMANQVLGPRWATSPSWSLARASGLRKSSRGILALFGAILACGHYYGVCMYLEVK